MAERLCEGCRFFKEPMGMCWRYPKMANTDRSAFCGEWRDKHITPEQEQRAELVRRFAVALVGTEWCYNPEARNFTANKVWEWAEKLADAEPPSNP